MGMLLVLQACLWVRILPGSLISRSHLIGILVRTDSCGLFMQMVIVSLCSIALVISILKPRKKAAKALCAAGSAAVVVGAMTSRVGTMTQRERDHGGEAEMQPLYQSDSGSGDQVDEMDGDMKRSEKVSDIRAASEMV